MTSSCIIALINMQIKSCEPLFTRNSFVEGAYWPFLRISGDSPTPWNGGDFLLKCVDGLATHLRMRLAAQVGTLSNHYRPLWIVLEMLLLPGSRINHSHRPHPLGNEILPSPCRLTLNVPLDIQSRCLFK